MPQEVKRVETRTVEREDVPADSEWDSAWAVDEDEPSTNENIDDTKVDVGNKHDIEEERRVTGFGTNADDGTADAWGWGEDDDVVEEWEDSEVQVDFKDEGWDKKCALVTPNVELEPAVVLVKELQGEVQELKELIAKLVEGKIEGKKEDAKEDKKGGKKDGKKDDKKGDNNGSS